MRHRISGLDFLVLGTTDKISQSHANRRRRSSPYISLFVSWIKSVTNMAQVIQLFLYELLYKQDKKKEGWSLLKDTK